VSSLRSIALTIWGLLVEDGSLAVGIIAALAITWIAAIALPDPARDQVGWLLVAMLVILVILNLRAAALGARRAVAARP
jgi:hypothetical protein